MGRKERRFKEKQVKKKLTKEQYEIAKNDLIWEKIIDRSSKIIDLYSQVLESVMRENHISEKRILKITTETLDKTAEFLDKNKGALLIGEETGETKASEDTP